MVKSKKTKGKIKKQTKKEELQEVEEQLSTEKQREQTLDNVLEFIEPEINTNNEKIDLSLSSGQSQQTSSSLQEISKPEKIGLGKEEARETEENEKPRTIYEQEETKYDAESPRINMGNERIEIDSTTMPTTKVNTSARTASMIDSFAGMGARSHQGGDYDIINIDKKQDNTEMPWESQDTIERKEKVHYKPRA